MLVRYSDHAIIYSCADPDHHLLLLLEAYESSRASLLHEH